MSGDSGSGQGGRFHSLDDLIEELRQQGLVEVSLSGEVDTTISPGGQYVRLNGRIVVAAESTGGERVEHTEYVMPYVGSAENANVPVGDDPAPTVRDARRVLARQIRSYRGEYQGIMDRVRDAMGKKLKKAGIRVKAPG